METKIDDKFAAIHNTAKALRQCRGLNHIQLLPVKRIGKDEYITATESKDVTHVKIKNNDTTIYVNVEANAPFFIIKAIIEAVERRWE